MFSQVSNINSCRVVDNDDDDYHQQHYRLGFRNQIYDSNFKNNLMVFDYSGKSGSFDDFESDYQRVPTIITPIMTEKNNNQQKQQIPEWILTDCPPSLKFLSKFFRIFFFTNGGIIFIGNDDELKNRYWIRFKHYLFKMINLYSIVGLFLGLIAEIYQGYFQNIPDSIPSSELINSNETIMMMMNELHDIDTIENFTSKLSLNRTMNQVDNVTELDGIFQSLYSIMQNNDELIETENLKPILKNIIKLLLVFHLIDAFILSIFSIFYGLRLIQNILSIPFVKEFDHSKKFAYRSLAISYIILTLISLTGSILFNKEVLMKIIDPQNSISTRFWKIFQIFGMVIGFSQNIVIPLLFIYTMMLFKFCIQRLIDNYAMVDNLDEINMIKLRAQLSDLNDRFKEILPYFSMPLTGMFASSIFIVISSSCFLMINNTSHSHYYISFVFCLGLIAFLRLIIVACFGNLPENCCRDLVRIVYENLQQWHLNEWMCFMEIKRLQKEFIVDIFSMYTVQQSSILAMLGFALNYIVILLQTENFSSSSSSSSSVSFSLQNNTDNNDTLINFNNTLT